MSEVKITVNINFFFMFLKDILLCYKFLTVLGILTYFNIAKMSYLENLSHIQNLNIFCNCNFW